MPEPTRRTADCTEAEWSARQQLAACYRIFDLLGWAEMIYNHISLRVPGPQRHFLINPFGLHYSEVTASSLLKVDLEGRVLGDSPYGFNAAGFTPHATLHGHVADAHCVMHTHTTAGMAVASSAAGPADQQLLRRAAGRARRVPRLRRHHRACRRRPRGCCSPSATSRP
jgi:ribulose-5-phosphate 4-epimerase/fuculose-1-phosphate aldolase